MPKVCDAKLTELRAQPNSSLFGAGGELCAKPGTEFRGCQLRADCRQLTALQKAKENLCRLPSPAKGRISQYKPWRQNWNLLLQQCQRMHWGKGLEIVQQQETLLLLGKESTINMKNIFLNLRLSGKVIKKGCCAFLLNDVSAPSEPHSCCRWENLRTGICSLHQQPCSEFVWDCCRALCWWWCKWDYQDKETRGGSHTHTHTFVCLNIKLLVNYFLGEIQQTKFFSGL